MRLNFTKMHGLGNDFVLIDRISQECDIIDKDFGNIAKKLCDRRFGIGADQILVLDKSNVADFRMLIFNADGSEVEMCGNGIRCLAKYIWDKKYSDKDILKIETLAGIIKPEKAEDMVKVDMGEPIFEPEKIPVDINKTDEKIIKENRRKISEDPELKNIGSVVIDYPLKIDDREFRITCVSMGNPHAVIVVENVNDFPVKHYGPIIEKHEMFPKRINVEFIEVITPSEIKMRVWERGSGETMACGTGASAVGVASRLKGLTEERVLIHLLGGDLLIEWIPGRHVYMTGPAEKVFEGNIII